MSLADILGYFFAGLCVASALYVAFSRDLLRVSIAFFMEIASVGGVLLSLNSDYIALTLFLVGVIGAVVVISFTGIILGNLRTSLRQEFKLGTQNKLARVGGMLLGLGTGAAIGWAFLKGPFADFGSSGEVSRETDVARLGRMLLGEQVVVFEVLAILLLIMIIGAGLLLRKPVEEEV